VQCSLNGFQRAVRVARRWEDFMRVLSRAGAGAVERSSIIHCGAFVVNPVVPAAVALTAGGTLAAPALVRAFHTLLGHVFNKVVSGTLVLALLTSLVLGTNLTHLEKKTL